MNKIDVGGSAGQQDTPHRRKVKEASAPLPSNVLVLDNTTLGDFKRSPRIAYYRHIRNWSPIGEGSAALVGGQAWSLAMDAIWPLLCQDGQGKPAKTWDLPTNDIADHGWCAFRKCWEDEFGIDPIELGAEQYRDFRANAPLVYSEMFLHYVNQRRKWLNGIRLLGVETPVVVPLLNVDREGLGYAQIYYGSRIDKLCAEGTSKFFWVDHKTTTKGNRGGDGFQPSWLGKFTPNAQTGGYNFSNFAVHGKKSTGGLIDAALCHREAHDQFTLMPIDTSFDMGEAWLNAVNYWAGAFANEWMTHLEWQASSKTYHYMPTFPCDGSSCDTFFGCAYRRICQSHTNPEELDAPPDGFEVNPWEPFSQVDHQPFGGSELRQALDFMKGGEDAS